MCGQIALQEIDTQQELLVDLAKKIWANPEVGYQEVKASEWTAQVLEEAGFQVERGCAGVPTALRAVWGSGKPVVGFLGEYDALYNLSQTVSTHPEPVLEGAPGHGCGHNLMAPACVGAVMGLKREMQARNLPGTLVFYGCPAEEMLTGKAFMARGGAFRELDIAFSWHPLQRADMMSMGTACGMNSAKFHFKGRTAHAGGDPENGRSALDAAQIMNTAVEYLREHVPEGVRIHYAFTEVPGSPNVVPENVTLWYYVRALSREVVEEVYRRVVRAAEGASWATETQMTVEFLGGCYETLQNRVLFDLLREAQQELPAIQWTPQELEFAKELNQNSANYSAMVAHGAIDEDTQMDSRIPPVHFQSLYGSNDVSEVQHILPAAFFGTASSNIGAAAHSWQIVACSGHSIGMKGMLQGAKIMALAALKALENPEIIARAKEEFQQQTHGRAYVCPIPDEVPVPGT